MLTERGLVLAVEGSESEESVFRCVQHVFLQQLPLLPADEERNIYTERLGAIYIERERERKSARTRANERVCVSSAVCSKCY
jgi:hypothetical protein